MKQSDMLQAALSQYPQNVRIESLHILAPGDDLLQEVVDKFLETRSKSYPAHVACFYETKSSNVGAIVGEKDRYVSFSNLSIISLLTVVGRKSSSMKVQVVSITQDLLRNTLLVAHISTSTSLAALRSLAIEGCVASSRT